MDYSIWGTRELIERIHELESTYKVNEKCAHCGDPMYGIIRIHHHTEQGKDVTQN